MVMLYKNWIRGRQVKIFGTHTNIFIANKEGILI